MNKKIVIKYLNKFLKKINLRITEIKKPPIDFDDVAINIIENVKPYTMTSIERIYAIINSVRYCINNNIVGAFVECGVWKGGSVLAMIETLKSLNINDIDIYLFDTFEGMPKPGNTDIDLKGNKAINEFRQKILNIKSSNWCNVSLEFVENLISKSGYPSNRIHYVKGMVEETIPDRRISQISILRLDTDWYESTKHELTYLYPLLVKHGVLIIDDYGHWKGARKAVDEYFGNSHIPIYLHRIDYTGRVTIKI